MIPVQHIHPMLVHFPIVFFFTLALFDVVAMARGATVTGRSVAGAISVALALAAGVAAVATYFAGDVALGVAEAGGFHSDVAEIHEGLGSVTMAVFAIWALARIVLWWRNLRLTGLPAILVPVFEVAGAILVTITAYYGGELVYGLGVNVAHAAGVQCAVGGQRSLCRTSGRRGGAACTLKAPARYPSRGSPARNRAGSSAGTAGHCCGGRQPMAGRDAGPGTSSLPGEACRPCGDCKASRR